MPNHTHLVWEQLKMNGKEFPINRFEKFPSQQRPADQLCWLGTLSTTELYIGFKIQIHFITGIQGIYPVTNFMEMEEVNFNFSKE